MSVKEQERIIEPVRRGIMGVRGEIAKVKAGFSVINSLPENLSSQCDNSNKVFTTDRDINSILVIHYNGGLLTEGVEANKTGDKELTLLFAPISGDDLRLKYI